MVSERMLECLENKFDGLSIHVDESEFDFELEFYSPAGEDFVFSVQAETDMELYNELRAYARDFDRDWHVKSVMGMNGAPDLETLVNDAKDIQKLLDSISEAARIYVAERETLLEAATHIKAGDSFTYTVGNQTYQGIAAEDAAINYDAEEPEWEVQMVDGGAVTLDSIESIEPIIANHIIDSAKDYDVNTLDTDEVVLELHVKFDALGMMTLENNENNAHNGRCLDGAWQTARFFEDASAEYVAYGVFISDEYETQCAWRSAINDGAEHEALFRYAESVTNEPVQETIQRMLREDTEPTQPKAKKEAIELD